MRKPQWANRVSALELKMRDTLDGVEDLAREFAFTASCADFEILGTEAPGSDDHLKSAPAVPSGRRPRPFLAYEHSDRDVA